MKNLFISLDKQVKEIIDINAKNRYININERLNQKSENKSSKKKITRRKINIILRNNTLRPWLKGSDNLYSKIKPTVVAMNTHIVEIISYFTPIMEANKTIIKTLKIIVIALGKHFFIIFLKELFLTKESLG